MGKKKRTFFSIALIALFVLSIANLGAYKVKAATLPSALSNAWYVPATWFSNYNNAYTAGQNSAGGPSNAGMIILDFGCQLVAGTSVQLCGGGNYTNAQVEQVVNNFAAGYYSTHTVPIILAVGTNNSNSSMTHGSSQWATNGTTWGNLVVSCTGNADVTICGANDFEFWGHTYGSDAINWLNASGAKCPMCINFGDDCQQEQGSSNYWSIDQVWQVSWGASSAHVTPEIYHDSWATQWQGVDQYKPLMFMGAMGEYNVSGQDNWLQAITALNNLLPSNFTSTFAMSMAWGS
jgi:hypothetical protein